ncbi:MAG: hypothetical protein ABR512_10430 [Desulfopila sp.]
MDTPSSENWYADTAYTAEKKKDLAPPDPSAWKMGERALRAHPLPLGVFCGDYRTNIRDKEVLALKDGIVDPVPNHEYTEMITLANPKVAFGTLQCVAGVLTLIGLFTVLNLNINIPPSSTEDIYCYLYLIVPFAIFVLSTIFQKIAPDKNNIVFNRRTGMVTIPSAKKVVPFAEFDGYYHCPQSTVGSQYSLHLGHRYSPVSIDSPNDWNERHWLHEEWEYYQQYMDISMPLPDTPDLESYRHLDPATAAYDKKHNRPPHYWHDIPIEQVKNQRDEGSAAVRNFPWNRLPPADHIPKECMDRLLPGARLFK